MLEQIKHVNSKNEQLDFSTLGFIVNYNDLRDYEWQVVSENDKVIGFKRGIVNKTIPFVFNCSDQEANTIKNTFYEHFEIDIINRKKGYFLIGDYKYYCYLTKSVKTDYLIAKGLLYLSIELTTDWGFWVNENKFTFIPEILEYSIDRKQYDYKYEYIYGLIPGQSEINITSLQESDFKMIIYGPVNNPEIRINGHLYNIKCQIGTSEYVVISSRERVISLVNNTGNAINVFDKRNFENYIFTKIPFGKSSVVWSGGFGFDLIVYDERSEPKWI